MVIVGRYIKKYLRRHPEVMEASSNKLMLKKAVTCSDCANMQKSSWLVGKSSFVEDQYGSCDRSPSSASLSSSLSSSSEAFDYPYYNHHYPECMMVVSSSQYQKHVLSDSP